MNVVVTGAVNQQVPLPAGGAVVINQQIGSASGNQGSLTVNALHVTIPATGPVPATNVVVASAHADIVCANPPPKCDSANDFVTGGGWILTTGGARANFAAAGGYKSGVPWGHFTYIDHGTGLKVKGTGVTGYAVTGPTSRHVEGTAEINGVPGSYKLDLADNGEPGRNDDYAVSLSTGYTAGGKLAGGNIQLHGSCQ